MSQVITIDDLRQQWKEAKTLEEEAKQRRLNIETEILLHKEVKGEIKDEGTSTFGKIKIITGYTRNWNQGKLQAICETVDESLWPFQTQYKEVRAGTKYIETNEPEMWEILSPALTLTPKKPSFSLAKDKEAA